MGHEDKERTTEQNMIKIFQIFYDFTQRVTGILLSLGREVTREMYRKTRKP